MISQLPDSSEAYAIQRPSGEKYKEPIAHDSLWGKLLAERNEDQYQTPETGSENP